MTHAMTFLILLLLFLISCVNASSTFNIMDFGAKPDGTADAAKAFAGAWSAACGAREAASVVVPKGVFFLSTGTFHGPCNSNDVKMLILGSIVAGTVKDGTGTWMVFRYVDGLSIIGGTVDGRGQEVWACKGSGKGCPQGASTLSINHCKNVLISKLNLINSQIFHLSLLDCTGVTIQNSKISAPGDSPNTDGIHIGMSTDITIVSMVIRTGDDCISLGPGCKNIWADNIVCGPGHGISIGSLAEGAVEEGVQNVTIKRTLFTNTTNGFRIKTWGRASTGFVNRVSFRHAVMQNVQNPIIIDQNYCPNNLRCPNQSSGIKVSNVKYNNIQGTSNTQIAVKFDCSPTNPCRGIRLTDINLNYQQQTALSFCKFVQGSTAGLIVPPSCF